MNRQAKPVRPVENDPDRSSALAGLCTARTLVLEQFRLGPWTYRPPRWQAERAAIPEGGTSHVRHETAGVQHAARRCSSSRVEYPCYARDVASRASAEHATHRLDVPG